MLWQSQYLSQGRDGKSQKYIKNSCIPELYAGVDYKSGAWLVGAGIEMISLKPRTTSAVDGKEYKVDERVTSLSYEVHMKYRGENWQVAAKSVLGYNLTHTSMLGGYGVKSVDGRTGEQSYSPNRNSSSWVNVVYGKKWKPALFFGYMKNLGTSDGVSKMYGTGIQCRPVGQRQCRTDLQCPSLEVRCGIQPHLGLVWFAGQGGRKDNGYPFRFQQPPGGDRHVYVLISIC